MAKKLNPIVLYSSNYGATRRYASWIAKSLTSKGFNCEARALTEINSGDLDGHDVVIYGGGLYMGKLNGVKKLVKLAGVLRGKKLVIFTVGVTDPSTCNNRELTSAEARILFPADIQENMKFFPLRGALDFSKLKFSHRFVLKSLVKALAKQPASDGPDAPNSIISRAYSSPVNFVEKGSIKELVNSLV